MNLEVYDVAIVGLGPTGVLAAALLGQRGLKVFAGDRQDAIYDKPRAIALDHEVLRTFQQLGVFEQIEPFTEPFTDSCFLGVDGDLIRRMTMVAPPYPQAHTPSVVFSQPPVEQVLRAAARALPWVRVATGLTLVDLQQDEDRVLLTWRAQDNSTRRVAARFAIGCDGAASSVRNMLGIALSDLGFDEPWLVVDVLVNERGLAKLPSTSVQYCEPDRPCTYVIGTKNHRRWEISLKSHEDPALMSEPDATWALLARWLTPEDGTLWRQASYRFHALVAECWRSGRVFIAGDAAHQQPPFLGQGMCQGVRDVVNLTWKLAEVLWNDVPRGAAEALLDSYGHERKAHVTTLTKRLKGIGALICERDRERALARDARLRADAGGTAQPTPRQDVLPRLDCGLLASTDNSARGNLCPQPWLWQDGQRVRMDSVLGTGWRLILAAGAGLAGATQEETQILALSTLRLGGMPGRVAEADGVMAQWFRAHQCRAALVRPDHYVFGTAHDAYSLRALLREAASALR